MRNFDKYSDSAKINYRPAFVYEKQGDFCIMFYWRPAADQFFKRYRRTFNLNRIADKEARSEAATIMALTVTKALKNGWNPETDSFMSNHNGVKIKPVEAIKLPLALERAHKSVLIKASAKERTKSSYKSHLKLFIAYLKKNGKYNIAPAEFSRMDANEYQDHLASKRYAAKTVNTKTDYASGLFGWMENTGLIKENPFAAVKHLREIESDAHQIFTRDEIEIIKRKLQQDCPQLWQFALFIYYCLMRPASIIAIKRADIDLKNMILTIRPDDHKNGKLAYKQILPPHEQYLRPYLDGIKPNEYLFSNGSNLTPGTSANYPTRAAELWAELVKTGCGIDKNMYGLKHTGAAHFLELNPGTENLKWLQMQMSHSDLQTTSIYTNKLKIVKLDENAKISII